MDIGREFFWERPRGGGGFHWLEPPGRPAGPGLREYEVRLVSGSVANWERYAPLREETGLFRNFAETPTTLDGVLAFANRYGVLMGSPYLQDFDIPIRCMLPAPTAEDASVPGPDSDHPASFSFWVREIHAMWEWVRLLDLLQAGDERGLKRLIRWEGADAVHYSPPAAVHVRRYEIASRAKDPWLFSALRRGEVLLPARQLLHDVVNGVIEHATTPTLTWRDPDRSSVLAPWPKHLQAALYVQLGLALCGDKKYRRCAECRKWFEVAPGVNRTSRLTCSAACRNKAYRERQAQARAMHAKGKSPAEIAAKLDTDVETVKGWLYIQ